MKGNNFDQFRMNINCKIGPKYCFNLDKDKIKPDQIVQKKLFSLAQQRRS